MSERYDQAALDAASREVHMMLLREGSSWGTKACEEMGRVFMTAYRKALPSEKGTNNAAPQEGTERLTAPGHAGDEYTEARSPVGAAPHPSQPVAEGTPRTDKFVEGWDYYNYPGEATDFARTLERELAKAKENYQFMVNRAADEKLDGYRELGAKCATLEERAEAAESRLSVLEADAQRYRWLRDQSVPPHEFYISVPDEFKDVRYTPQQVDAYIDAARTGVPNEC